MVLSSVMFVVMAWAVSVDPLNGQRVSTGARDLPSGLCQQLFDADSSDTFVKNQDYGLNVQGKTYKGDWKDRASRKLFTWVNNKKLLNKPTFSAFIDLLDNYILHTGSSETLTLKEKAENRHFLDVIMKTNTMKIAHKYLVSQSLAPKDVGSFKQLLNKTWLYFYRRGAYRDSSSFEHVFVGEVRGLKIGGFHNWVEYYLLEKAGKVDYKGYFQYVSSKPSYVTLRMTMGNASKPYGGFFIGTSPQFELALYTMCFLKFPDGDCNCKINSRRVKITTYGIRGTSFIGTAYPTVY